MSLVSAIREFGGSMLELNIAGEQEDSPKFKESKGLLRRAFSSKKRKKKTDVNARRATDKISPEDSCACICYGGVHIGDIHAEYSRWVIPDILLSNGLISAVVTVTAECMLDTCA